MKVALIGYGKMGKTIEQVLQQQALGDRVVLKITDQNLNELTSENLQQADVAIEFTKPDAALANICTCIRAQVPVVVGTTAWYQHLPEVKSLCEEARGAVFYAPNFSIGVNIFFEMNKKLAAIMHRQPQYRVAMEEIHHTEKLDAPSGTAIRTAEIILQSMRSLSHWQLLEPNREIAADALPINALRQPNVPGTHTVKFTSACDELVLTHQAFSRQGFAEGAIAAARWLIGKQGVFDMKDMLHL